MRLTSTTVTVEAEVEISDVLEELDDDQLKNNGLHRAEQCITDPDALARELHGALNALHQQAHNDQPLFLDACLREPCRSLSLRKFPQLGTSR